MNGNNKVLQILFLLFMSTSLFAGKTKIIVKNHKPFNLFSINEKVNLKAVCKVPPGSYELTASRKDYFGHTTTTKYPISNKDKTYPEVNLDFGQLPPGYYELNLSLKGKTATGEAYETSSAMNSFGVVRFVERTAEQALQDKSRFGLKMWQLGKPGVWWRRPLVWDVSEAVDATCKLGLNWTRHQFNQQPSPEPGKISTVDLVTKYPINAVLKIESFPESCFDAERYGPLEEWKKKKKKWNKKTVPKKEPYQKWLREELAKIPKTQTILEIANEPWGKMSPEEFAEYCQMVREVVKEVRPDAILGPNSAMGPIEWEIRCIKAGGYDGMTMLAPHPYSFTPMPERRVRGWIRNYREFIRLRMRKDLPLYVTEYGWSTAPQNKKYGKTERQQAQRTVRQSLMLYAEDCKTLIPHWMADREHDPKEREHWFGFFRLNRQPKPVIIAHAVSARMIDGGRFVGDLWYGPGIGAMLFERKGVYTLALWTLDEKLGTGKNLNLNTGVKKLQVVDIMGQEKQVNTKNGKLSLKVNGDMTYLVGVSPALAQKARKPNQDLIDKRWNIRAPSLSIPAAQTPPKIDGVLDEWTEIKAIEIKGNKTPLEDASAMVKWSWDKDFLYLAVNVKDEKIINNGDPADLGKKARKPLTRGDAFRFNICSRPARQPSIGGTGTLYEYSIVVTPTSGKGTPVLRINNLNWDKPLINPADPRWAFKEEPGGWSAEIAIPNNLLKDFPQAKPGTKLSTFLRLIDVDKDKEKPTIMASQNNHRNCEWAYLIFK